MPRRDGDWYDVMQVCGNGHMITSSAIDSPENKKNRCPDCGAETMTTCPSCNTDIQGYHHMAGVAHFGPDGPPAFCHACGDAYPWTSATTELPEAPDESDPELTDRVFIVHGHDDVMKLSVARALTDLGLKPIILHEQPNSGKTIIEKFERDADVGFAVVLLSPDDMAYVGTADPSSAKPRARQNVVVELGYFVGSLGRDRVMALKRGNDLEVPSDFNGVVYTQYDDAGNWKFELVRELKAAGYDVDANALI